MARYRKKPVVIHAVLNDGEWAPILAWLDGLAGGRMAVPFGARPAITRNDDGTLNIDTAEGRMRADVGDFVICGVQGELYPCKPDIFEATYEHVDGDDHEDDDPERNRSAVTGEFVSDEYAAAHPDTTIRESGDG